MAGAIEIDISMDELLAVASCLKEAPEGSLARNVGDRISKMLSSRLLLRVNQEMVLTERQVSILKSIAEGHTAKEIEQQLAYSKSTIKREVRQILERLEVSNRSEAVAIALVQGLI
jgi:DNA-binding NarL/FixJ family response regulator